MTAKDEFVKIGSILNDKIKQYNYCVSSVTPGGKPGKNNKTYREYRLHLIIKTNDTSDKLIAALKNIIVNSFGIKTTDITFNAISPNSSKFPSYSFTYNNQKYDLVIARGANKGENFEVQTVTNLSNAFGRTNTDANFLQLIKQLNEANSDFAGVEIKLVTQRTGSTKKTGVRIEDLDAVIGDIILKDTNNKNWYVSLKDTNGKTLSAFPGGGSLFKEGNLIADSEGAKFLNMFGVDLNLVQQGFDLRNKIKTIRKRIPIARVIAANFKKIFEVAWGMNYFYVRRLSVGWKVFFINRTKLDKLTSNITVTKIKYPDLNTKTITIFCGNAEQKYDIQIRNSAGGEYPNDIKISLL